MGTVTYDFLTESLLFDESLIENRFHRLEEDRLRRELQAYRDFCISHLDTIEEEASQKKSNIKIFSALDRTDLDLLKQAAFYVDQFILPDPIFPLTYKGGEVLKTMRSYLKMSDKTIDRNRLSLELAYLKSLTPLVSADYVKFLPVSYLFEPPNQLPVSYSENYFSDILPKELMQYFHENVIVESLIRVDAGWIVKPDLFPSRGIAVRFRGHDAPDIYMYQLFEQRVISLDEETRVARFEMNLPDEPPNSELFNAWVFQSINKAARDFYDRVISEVALGTRCQASYLSRSPFTFDLLGKLLPSNEDLKTDTARRVLNMELPFLDNIDFGTLMTIRLNDGEAFESFRLELDRQFRELRVEKDPERFAIKAENAMHEICEVQLQKVNKKMRSLRRGALAQAIVLIAGLAGAVQTGGWSVIASAIALAKGYRTYVESLLSG